MIFKGGHCNCILHHSTMSHHPSAEWIILPRKRLMSVQGG